MDFSISLKADSQFIHRTTSLISTGHNNFLTIFTGYRPPSCLDPSNLYLAPPTPSYLFCYSLHFKTLRCPGGSRLEGKCAKFGMLTVLVDLNRKLQANPKWMMKAKMGSMDIPWPGIETITVDQDSVIQKLQQNVELVQNPLEALAPMVITERATMGPPVTLVPYSSPPGFETTMIDKELYRGQQNEQLASYRWDNYLVTLQAVTEDNLLCAGGACDNEVPVKPGQSLPFGVCGEWCHKYLVNTEATSPLFFDEITKTYPQDAIKVSNAVQPNHCPVDYRWAFRQGWFCCKTRLTCDSSVLEYKSLCCMDHASVVCGTTKRCTDFQELSLEKLPLSGWHPPWRDNL